MFVCYVYVDEVTLSEKITITRKNLLGLGDNVLFLVSLFSQNFEQTSWSYRNL